MNKLKNFAFGATVAFFGVLSFAAIQPVVDTAQAGCTGAQCLTTGAQGVDTGGGTDVQGIIKNIVNVLLFLVGVLSVIMLIMGGIRYTTSGGNPEQIKAAKNTIMYAVVGIIVAIAAYAIVNFVITTFTGGGGGGSNNNGGGGQVEQ